jgi:hypothetical protein
MADLNMRRELGLIIDNPAERWWTDHGAWPRQNGDGSGDPDGLTLRARD